MTAARHKALVAWFIVLCGAMVTLAAFDVGPMAGAGMHAPRWIIALCGLGFLTCGALVLVSHRGAGRFLAAACVIAMTAVCAWISIFGDARYFSSSIAFIPDDVSVLLARVLFGAIAVMGFAICVRAITGGKSGD